MDPDFIRDSTSSLQHFDAPTPLRAMIAGLIGSNRHEALRLIRTTSIRDWAFDDEPTPTLTIAHNDRMLRFVYDTTRKLRAVHIAGPHGSISLDGSCNLAHTIASDASKRWAHLDITLRNNLARALESNDLRSIRILGDLIDTTNERRLGAHRWERNRALQARCLFAGETLILSSQETTVKVFGPEGDSRRAEEVRNALLRAAVARHDSGEHSWWEEHRLFRWLLPTDTPPSERASLTLDDTHLRAQLRLDTPRLEEISSVLGLPPNRALDSISVETIHRFMTALSRATASPHR